MAKVSVKSAEQMKAEQGDFKLLPEDEYIASVESIEVLEDQTSQFQPEKHQEWKVRFDLISFSNQEPIYYEDQSEPDPTKPVRLTCYINPTKMGFSNAGVASKARKFIAAAYGVPVAVETDADTDEMVNKRLIIRNIHKPDRDGTTRDRIEDFRALRSRPAAKTEQPAKAATEDVEAAAEASLAKGSKKAAEVFDDELRF